MNDASFEVTLRDVNHHMLLQSHHNIRFPSLPALLIEPSSHKHM
jgi:hypothetical protein